MTESRKEEHGNKKRSEVKIFQVPFDLEEVKDSISISTNKPTKVSKEEIIKQAFKFHSQGNIQEAVQYYQDFINQGFEDYRAFANYASILKSLGKLQEEENSIRKAIRITFLS